MQAGTPGIMNAIWSEKVAVRSYDVSSAGVLKPQVIFQFFQEAAANHATHLGAGYEALQSLGLFWALSRIKVEIHSLPAWGDDVIITTWPKGVERLFALRDFRVAGKDGAAMVLGTSYWLLLDAAKMRPRRIESLPHTFPIDDKEHALKESLEKISVPPRLDAWYERKVMASDLDVNNHVNNTEYVRWIADCLATREGAIPMIRSLQVNYLEEAKLGDLLLFSLGREETQPGAVYIEGKNSMSQVKVVQARAEIHS